MLRRSELLDLHLGGCLVGAPLLWRWAREAMRDPLATQCAAALVAEAVRARLATRGLRPAPSKSLALFGLLQTRCRKIAAVEVPGCRATRCKPCEPARRRSAKRRRGGRARCLLRRSRPLSCDARVRDRRHIGQPTRRPGSVYACPFRGSSVSRGTPGSLWSKDGSTTGPAQAVRAFDVAILITHRDPQLPWRHHRRRSSWRQAR